MILNGDSSPPTRIVDGDIQIGAPTTAEQMLAKKNKLKARGTLLMALPYKHQLKFNIHKDAKSLMEAIEKRFGVNAAPSIFVASSKATVSTLPDVDSLSDAVVTPPFWKITIVILVRDRCPRRKGRKSSLVKLMEWVPKDSSLVVNLDILDLFFMVFQKCHVRIFFDLKLLRGRYEKAKEMVKQSELCQMSQKSCQSNSPQLDNEDLKQIDPDDLEEMDLKWKMDMLTMRARRRGHFARECRSPKDNRNKDTPRRTVPVEAEEEPTNYALMAYASSGSSSSLGSDNENDRYTTSEGYRAVPPPYTRAFLPFKLDLVFIDDPNASESVTNVLNVDSSINKSRNDMSKIHRPDAPIVEDWISGSEDETKIESVSKQIEPSFVKSSEHVKSFRESINKVEHNIQAENLKTNNQKSRGHKINWKQKPCFVCRSLNHLIKDCDYYEKQMVQNPVWNSAIRVNHQNSVRMTHPHSNRHVVPTAVLTRSKLVSLNAARPVPTAVTQSSVKSPWPVKHVVNKAHSPVWKPKCKVLDHVSRLTSPSMTLKTFTYTEALGRSKVPKENNMYNVDLKNVVPSGGLTCLFAKATLDESNLWHKRLGHINFKTMNKLVKDPLRKFDGKADEGFLVGYSINRIGRKWMFDIYSLTMSMNYQPVVTENQPNDNAGIKENLDAGKVGKETVSTQQYVLLPLSSTSLQDPQNIDDDVANVVFDVKENENDVHVFANGSDKTDTKKHDEKAKRDDKGKSHVDSPTRVRDLRAEFKEFYFNSTNRVNDVSAPVTTAEPNPTHNTNSFNTASPSVNVVSPNFRIAGKSSFVDPFKYPNDPDMPELEDIVYSDDEEDVGFEYPDYLDKVYKVFKALYGLHQAPRAWYDTLANYLLENGVQRGKIDQTLFINKQKGDILLVQMSSMRELTFFLRLQVKQKDDGIFISQDKYVAKILRKFGFTDVKSTSTPIKTEKPLLKDPDGKDVNVYIYRYLKGNPHLGLWYPKDSLFNLMAYSDSDYAGASLNRKSTTGGCQFLGCRLISWQRKKQTVVATSSTEAEYVAVVLMLYGFKIILIEAQQHISNESPLLGVNTPRCDEYTIKLKELMVFMATAIVRKVNDVVQLRALIDGKKVVVSEAIIRRDLHLNDSDGVECLPNEEIFTELARMGYEKPLPKLTFYKAFFSAQWKFLIHTLVQCLSAKRTAWNEFSCFMASAVICLATVVMDNQVDDMTSHNTRYTSPALTHKVFANIRRVGKGFSGVETPLFAFLLVQPQPQAEEEVEMLISPAPPSPKTQPTTSYDSNMLLFITLMVTCATLSQTIAELEQDEHSQALEILQLKKRVKKLEKKKKSKSSWFKRLIRVGGRYTDKGITLVDVETQEEVVAMDAEPQGRLNQEDVSVAEPTVFDDEEDREEKADMERALELQRQYDDKEENIDWNAVAEQIQERHLDNIKKYQNLKKILVSIAQARKNMIIYLKNMAGYKIEHFRGMTYDKESFKKLKAVEVSGSESTQEIPSNDLKEMSEEDIHNMLEIVPVLEFKVKALQVKYPIIYWEIHSEDLVALWNLVKEKFSSAVPSEDKEKALWVELKRLFEPDADDVLWKLQRYMHAPLTWKLYTNCGVHHVSSTRGNDIFMLTEKDYPLLKAIMILMLSGKLQVEEDNKMARDLVMKIFMEANKPKSRSLDTSFK
uniref:Uncharacterized protein n=1 Tax=Tanacetum cinerariifolium TaxID=118510 RepID=A0A6L2LJA4_TANCI|nr:hypothetical protein [Tanacetum cinerariifolium]